MRNQGGVRDKERKLGSSARGGARAPGGPPGIKSAVGGEQTLSDLKLPGFGSQRAAKASGLKRRMKATAEASGKCQSKRPGSRSTAMVQ